LAPSSPLPLIETVNLTKRFGSVLANDGISVAIEPGEIHCLLGENGAGKTTLAECLYGFYQPDGGEIRFKGRPVDLSSPRDAIRLGIGMVHQHFVLIRPFTVLENIVLSAQETDLVLNLSRVERRLAELCEEYGVELDLHAQIWQLSVGEQQWVEILKALYARVDLLILDEPTAVLTPQETQRLFAVLERMKADGLAILLITHKLAEVSQVADRVSILRRGRLVDTVRPTEVDRSDLARLMVGRDVNLHTAHTGRPVGASLLQVEDLVVLGDREQQALREVSFTLHAGEILGLAGVAGNGQRELFQALVGVRRAEAGRVLFDGADVTHESPRQLMRRGIAHVPDDRITEGLVGDLSVAENLILGQQRRQRYRRGPFLAPARIRAAAGRLITDYDIATPSLHQKTKFLSGGNLQKVILARELSQQPRCLLANQPTRGLDVGVIEYVHQQLIEGRDRGMAILLISEDLDELFALSNRIMVLYKGMVMGIVETGSSTPDAIGLLMAGIQEGA
jgi:simple sugar transport system ATP-binding protein